MKQEKRNQSTLERKSDVRMGEIFTHLLFSGCCPWKLFSLYLEIALEVTGNIWSSFIFNFKFSFLNNHEILQFNTLNWKLSQSSVSCWSHSLKGHPFSTYLLTPDHVPDPSLAAGLAVEEAVRNSARLELTLPFLPLLFQNLGMSNFTIPNSCLRSHPIPLSCFVFVVDLL